MLILAITLIFLGLFLLLAVLLGLATRSDRQSGRLERRLRDYTVQPANVTPDTAAGARGELTRRTVDAADKVVRSRGLEESLGNMLQAASLTLRPAEWLLLHIGITIGSALVFWLITSLNPVAAVVGMAIGLVLPYAFISIKTARRRAAFRAALPDMLQMAAGSLAAGHSLMQAIESVTRNTDGPMADELNRAMVETRLGAELEDSLNAVATRMNSFDMAWTVMAIRIQREVGGNLSEVLLRVGETMRERERIRRQVKALSAEGRMSAYILAALPIVFTIYLVLFRPEYFGVMVSNPLGIAMLTMGVGLLVAGIFWMRKLVRVEV